MITKEYFSISPLWPWINSVNASRMCNDKISKTACHCQLIFNLSQGTLFIGHKHLVTSTTRNNKVFISKLGSWTITLFYYCANYLQTGNGKQVLLNVILETKLSLSLWQKQILRIFGINLRFLLTSVNLNLDFFRNLWKKNSENLQFRNVALMFVGWHKPNDPVFQSIIQNKDKVQPRKHANQFICVTLIDFLPLIKRVTQFLKKGDLFIRSPPLSLSRSLSLSRNRCLLLIELIKVLVVFKVWSFIMVLNIFTIE